MGGAGLAHARAAEDLEAGRSEPSLVGTRVGVAPVHLGVRPEPVLFRAGVGGLAGRDEEQAVRLEPAVHALQERPLFVERDVDERVEADDPAERVGTEPDLGHVGPDEAGRGDQPAGPPDLDVGDVDPGHAEPVGEEPRVRHPAAAAEVEDLRTAGHGAEERLQPLLVVGERVAEVVRGAVVRPVDERDAVPSLADEPLGVGRLGAGAWTGGGLRRPKNVRGHGPYYCSRRARTCGSPPHRVTAAAPPTVRRERTEPRRSRTAGGRTRSSGPDPTAAPRRSRP